MLIRVEHEKKFYSLGACSGSDLFLFCLLMPVENLGLNSVVLLQKPVFIDICSFSPQIRF